MPELGERRQVCAREGYLLLKLWDVSVEYDFYTNLQEVLIS